MYTTIFWEKPWLYRDEYSEPCQISKRLQAVNYFCKKLHLRRLAGFRIRFWYQRHNVNPAQNFQSEDHNPAKENRKEMNLMKEMPEHGLEFYLWYIPDKKQKQQSTTLLRMKLWHRCFPLNFAKYLRTTYYL